MPNIMRSLQQVAEKHNRQWEKADIMARKILDERCDTCGGPATVRDLACGGMDRDRDSGTLTCENCMLAPYLDPNNTYEHRTIEDFGGHKSSGSEYVNEDKELGKHGKGIFTMKEREHIRRKCQDMGVTQTPEEVKNGMFYRGGDV
jgi:hypothetical protein